MMNYVMSSFTEFKYDKHLLIGIFSGFSILGHCIGPYLYRNVFTSKGNTSELLFFI